MRVLAIVQQDDAGPGVFADVIRERGATLELWRAAEEPAPERPDPDAVIALGGAMNTRDAAHMPWLGTQKELLRRLIGRRRAGTGRVPGRAAAGRGGGGRGAAGERSRDRLARGAARGRGGRRRPHGATAAVVLRLPVALLRGGSAAGLGGARPQRPLPAGLPANGAPAWGMQFHAEVDPDGAGGLDRRLPQRPRRGAPGAGPRRAAGRDRAAHRGVEPPRARAVRAVPGRGRPADERFRSPTRA